MKPTLLGSLASAIAFVAITAPASAFCDHKHSACCCKTTNGAATGQISARTQPTAPVATRTVAAQSAKSAKSAKSEWVVVGGGSARAVTVSEGACDGSAPRGVSAGSAGQGSCSSSAPAATCATKASSASGDCDTTKARSNAQGVGRSKAGARGVDATTVVSPLPSGSTGPRQPLTRAEGGQPALAQLALELPTGGESKACTAPAAGGSATPVQPSCSSARVEEPPAEGTRVRSLLARVRAPDAPPVALAPSSAPSSAPSGGWTRVAEAPRAPEAQAPESALPAAPASERDEPVIVRVRAPEAQGESETWVVHGDGLDGVDEVVEALVIPEFAEALDAIEMPEFAEAFAMPEFDFDFDFDTEGLSPEEAEEVRKAHHAAMESARAAHAQAMETWKEHQKQWREHAEVWQREARKQAKQAQEHAREQQKRWSAQARDRGQELRERARAEAQTIETRNLAQAEALRQRADELKARLRARADEERVQARAGSSREARSRSNEGGDTLPERIARLESELEPKRASEPRSLEERVAELEKLLQERDGLGAWKRVAPEGQTFYLGRGGAKAGTPFVLLAPDAPQPPARPAPGVYAPTPDGTWRRMPERELQQGRSAAPRNAPSGREDDALRSEIETRMKELHGRMDELRQRMQKLREELQESSSR